MPQAKKISFVLSPLSPLSARSLSVSPCVSLSLRRLSDMQSGARDGNGYGTGGNGLLAG